MAPPPLDDHVTRDDCTRVNNKRGKRMVFSSSLFVFKGRGDDEM